MAGAGRTESEIRLSRDTRLVLDMAGFGQADEARVSCRRVAIELGDPGQLLGEKRGEVHRCSLRVMAASDVLILDNIDICQYLGTMKRQTDPDVLLLQAAADPTRLAILRELSAQDPVCACDFTSCCDVQQPTVSHHLKVLREAGWVDSERRGTSIFYRLRPDAVARFRQLSTELVPTGVARPASFAAPRRLAVIQPTT